MCNAHEIVSRSHKCAFQLKPLEQYLKPIKKELLMNVNDFSTFIFYYLNLDPMHHLRYIIYWNAVKTG